MRRPPSNSPFRRLPAQSQFHPGGRAAASRRLPAESELHRRGDRLPPRPAAVPQRLGRLLRLPARLSASPATSSPMPEGTPVFPGEPVADHPRADHRSADSRDLPARGHRLPEHDRDQGGALRRGGGGPAGGRVRHAPRAHARSRRARRARRLHRRLRRHQQHAGGLPLRHSGDGHVGALLGDVVPLRDARRSASCSACSATPPSN